MAKSKSTRGPYLAIVHALFSGPDFQSLPGTTRWTFVCLKKNTSGMAGIDVWYRRELEERLAVETGWPLETVVSDMATLERNGWIRHEDNVLWVVDHLTHDPGAPVTDENKRTNVQRHVAALPRRQIVRDFIAHHPQWFPDAERTATGLEWTLVGAVGGSGESPPGVGGESLDSIAITRASAKRARKNPASGEAAPKEKGLALLSRADCDRLFEVYAESRGPIKYPRFRRAVLDLFQPGVPRYEIAEIADGIMAYGEWVREQPDREQAFCTVERMVSEMPKWIKFGKMPLTVNGDLTERGSWAGSKALREEAAARRSA